MGQTRFVCRVDEIAPDAVRRFDLGDRTFAIYRTADEEFYATDGLCTHEQIHLADGQLMDGEIECPMHFGRFDIRTGEALSAPVCIDLRTYPIKVSDGCVFILLADEPSL